MPKATIKEMDSATKLPKGNKYHKLRDLDHVEPDIEAMSEEIAEKFDVPVHKVQKKLQTMRKSVSKKQSLELLSCLPLALSNENSCASSTSNCTSPKENERRSTRSTRSLSQLSTASQASERANSCLTRKSPTSKKNKSKQSKKFTPAPDDDSSTEIQLIDSTVRGSAKVDTKRSTRSVSRVSTASQPEHTRSSLSATVKTNKLEVPKKQPNTLKEDETSIEIQSVESNGYKEKFTGGPCVKLSESSFICSDEALQEAVNSALESLSDTPSKKTKMSNNSVSECTRTFFETMAMTVSTFPPHVQAKVKIQICNIVGETEYGLCLAEPC